MRVFLGPVVESFQAGLPLALPSSHERHGKLVSKCLPWMWSLTHRLIHLWQGMEAAEGVQFKGQTGQEVRRETWEVTACHVGKQAPTRSEGARCRAGQEVPTPASLMVTEFFPEKV